MSTDAILSEIDKFLARKGVDMAETTFGRLAVNDGKFVARLRNGGRIWPETEKAVRDFIRSRRNGKASA